MWLWVETYKCIFRDLAGLDNYSVEFTHKIPYKKINVSRPRDIEEIRFSEKEQRYFDKHVFPYWRKLCSDYDTEPIGWSEWSVTKDEWKFIKKIIDEKNVKTVLEFGCGKSTLLFERHVDLVSFDDNIIWADKVTRESNTIVQLWDGKNLSYNNKSFDMVFVDGPKGGENREISTQLATLLSDKVLIHDANRHYEMVWQDKYLKDKFKVASEYGNCRLWEKLKGEYSKDG
jgi:hypothetical protein